MKAVHRTNPDPQRRAPAGVCARCGGEWKMNLPGSIAQPRTQGAIPRIWKYAAEAARRVVEKGVSLPDCAQSRAESL